MMHGTTNIKAIRWVFWAGSVVFDWKHICYCLQLCNTTVRPLQNKIILFRLRWRRTNDCRTYCTAVHIPSNCAETVTGGTGFQYLSDRQLYCGLSRYWSGGQANCRIADDVSQTEPEVVARQWVGRSGNCALIATGASDYSPSTRTAPGAHLAFCLTLWLWNWTFK